MLPDIGILQIAMANRIIFDLHQQIMNQKSFTSNEDMFRLFTTSTVFLYETSDTEDLASEIRSSDGQFFYFSVLLKTLRMVKIAI